MSDNHLKHVFILNLRRHLKTHLYSLNIFLTLLRIQKFKYKYAFSKQQNVILESWTWLRTGDLSLNFLSAEAFHPKSSLTCCTFDHCMDISRSWVFQHNPVISEQLRTGKREEGGEVSSHLI